MPRKQPTRTIDVLGQLDSQPVQKVWDYLTSKNNAKYFLKIPTSWEYSPEMFYIFHKIDHDTMIKQLSELNENSRLQSIVSSQRVERAQKDYAELRAHFITVNNFLRDLDDKKKFALKKINSEMETHRELSEAIALRKESLTDLSIFREKLRSTAEEYRLYETVLEQAVKKYPDVNTVQDLISRCDALMLGQSEITALNAKKFEEIEGMHKRIVEISKHAELIFVGLKNELTELERSYRKALLETMCWEKIVLTANLEVIGQDLKKGRIRDGLYTLYRLLCKKSGTEALLLRNDVEKIVDFIKDEVLLLQECIAIYNRRQKHGK